MADWTISLNLRNSNTGDAFDADAAPVLRDPTATFGVKADVSGTILAAAGTALTRTALGKYAITFTGLTPGTAYTYWLEVAIDGRTDRREVHHTISGGPSGYYATVADLEAWQGEANVDIYSNPTAATTRVEVRLQAALDRADAEINGALRNCGYAYPLSRSHPDFTLLTHVAVRLALFYLFSPREGRDAEDGGPPTEYIRSRTWRKDARDELNRVIVFGLGGAERLADSPTTPSAVE